MTGSLKWKRPDVCAVQTKGRFISIDFLLSAPLLLLIFVLPVLSQEWNQIVPQNSPDARYGHGMVQQPDGTVMLVGGKNSAGDYFNDTYTFKNGSWNQIEPESDKPEPRYGHSIVQLSDGRFVLFGGENDEGDLLNDLVTFTDNNYIPEIPANNPPPARRNHASFTHEDYLYIVGGVGATGVMNDLWRYNLHTQTWERLQDCLGPLEGAAVAKHGDKAYVLSYWEVDFYYNIAEDQWTTIPRTVPHPCARKFAAVTQTDQCAYVMSGSGSILNDTWKFDFTTESWMQEMDMPLAVTKSAAAIYGNQVIVFGGLKEDSSTSGETFLYSPPGTGIDNEEVFPITFDLYQNYPNPFNPVTTIFYTLSANTSVSVNIYDMNGKLVKSPVDHEYQQSGHYSLNINASELCSGLYIYCLQTPYAMSAKKMLIEK
ncbi:T9SS type A sorting domain-containing protein [bacterium]|nr:T9SS type A sorting domain-containing protein [bacterium]